MQLNWPVHHNQMDWEQVQGDYIYNIEKGAEVLASSVVTVDVNTGDLSATSDPIEQYLRLWAYNGYSNKNNPVVFNSNRNWKDGKRIICPQDTTEHPYQERILYAAKCNPSVDGVTWNTINDFPLPDDDLFKTDFNQNWGPTRDILIFSTQANVNCYQHHISFEYTLPTTQTVTTQITIKDDGPWNEDAIPLITLPPNQNQWAGKDEAGLLLPNGTYWFTVAVSNTQNHLIGLQSNPISITCTPLYLPPLLKNYPPVYFFETFNPLQPDWLFYNNDPQNTVDDYIYVIHTEGQDDRHALLMTEQVGLLSFTSGGYYSLSLSPPAKQVSLSFWVKRVGDYGAFRVLVDNAIVVSEQSTSASWHQHRVDVSTAATDGELILHFQVPSQFLGQTVLFDNIRVTGQ